MSGNTPAHRLVAGALAMAITAVCTGMAGLSAAERASTTTDKAMLIGLAVTLVAGSHLLPALSRKSWFVRAVFIACVVVTLYNHAYFFDGMKHRAGESRAQAVVATSHTLALQSELAAITARPMAVVAGELAQATTRNANAQAVLARCETTTPGRCTAATVAVTTTVAKVNALKTEAVESARAADLRSQLANAASAHDTARAAVTADPVDAQIANMTGLSVGTVGMLSAVAQSLLLEVLGTLLWAAALPVAAGAAQQVVAPVPVRGTDRAITGTAPTAKPVTSTVTLPKSLALLPGAGIRWRGSIPRLINAMHRFKVNTARHLSAIVRYPKMPACGTNPAL
ncbi:MAG: hypothetical protein K2Q11_11475 [Burkholderiaceae bacterium]|nr:hypothetical protein [Burkholderiaceae bacterium]